MWALFLTLVLITQRPLYAQVSSPWFVRGEVGKAEIHKSPDDSFWGALRVGRLLEPRGYIQLDGGLGKR